MGFRKIVAGLIMLIVAAAITLARAGEAAIAEPRVSIVIAENAAPIERIAVREFVEALARMYPNERFEIRNDPPESGRYVLIGNVKANARIARLLGDKRLQAPESFAVAVVKNAGRDVAVITGADPRGTAYGVYALLEKLGCGFYLSYDAFPAPRREPFSFEGWALADRPLVADRFVFNWHNFLSGCSTWNLDDWRRWVAQSQKMGYNGVMVHAYGNNPMASFTFNGVEKPIGYLSTTRRGRDWSTQHVNDVRRLYGGFVFDGPVFGAQAAMADEAKRAESAQRLMRDVFDYAEERAMDVFLAVDVDTASANPQALIKTLPESARFAMNQGGGALWLADPDTPEGYVYYKAQVDALLAAYPRIDTLVVWFRRDETPWMAFKVEEMPARWQEEYRAELAKTPGAASLWKAHNFFALGKIVRAFERALREGGRDDVKLAVGSWTFRFLPGCDRFLPRGVKFIPLDYDVLHDRSQLDTAEARRAIREVGAHRAVAPVVWAHHDDGNYVGRPYTPYANFFSKLEDSAASGFGIIHWTTRPLDLYFKSLIDQVWQGSKDQPLREACAEMAERSFGAAAREPMSEYLYRWITEAPKIGRETSDWFIDRKLSDMTTATAGCEKRLAMLNGIDAATLDEAARDRLNYFKGLEQYLMDVYRNEEAYQRAREFLRAGKIDEARRATAECDPGAAIERYARFSSLGGITRGEQGLVVSMNTRWLPHYLRLRQALGIEPVGVNFAPTSHDPLAQSMGTYTFHFDAERNIWATLGTKETGAPIFELPEGTRIARAPDPPAAYEETCRKGIVCEKAVTISLRPIMAASARDGNPDARLPAGRYRVRLNVLNPVAKTAEMQFRRIDLQKPGAIELTYVPEGGNTVLCGVIAEPMGVLATARLSASNEYNVSIVGNDVNPGTREAPFQTIQKAADMARSGDTVRVRPGRYAEEVTIRNSGVSFVAAGAQPALVDGGGVRSFGFHAARDASASAPTGFTTSGLVANSVTRLGFLAVLPGRRFSARLERSIRHGILVCCGISVTICWRRRNQRLPTDVKLRAGFGIPSPISEGTQGT